MTVPHLAFGDRVELDLGGVRCVVEHVGGDHSDDACVAWVPEDGLLFLGDALYQALYAPAEHYTPARLVPLVDRVASFGARVAIAGHRDELCDAAGLAAELALLRRCARRAQELGQAALDGAESDEEREIVRLALAGFELHGAPARYG